MRKPKTNIVYMVCTIVFFILIISVTFMDKHETRHYRKWTGRPNNPQPAYIDKSGTATKGRRDSIARFLKKSGHMKDGNKYDDPYDNPDFDDLFPGEEYYEEFTDRNDGDGELYN